jgi:hypothetical protein
MLLSVIATPCPMSLPMRYQGCRTREDPATQASQPHPVRIYGRREEGWHDNSPRYELSLVSYPHAGVRGKGKT